MTRPYAVDRRERVVRAVEAGRSRRAAARRFEVSVSLVIKLVQRWRQEGSLAPARYGGWKRAVLAAHAERVHELVRREPDLTMCAVAISALERVRNDETVVALERAGAEVRPEVAFIQ